MEKPKKGARFGIRSSRKLEQSSTESKISNRISEPSHIQIQNSPKQNVNNQCSHCTICSGKK